MTKASLKFTQREVTFFRGVVTARQAPKGTLGLYKPSTEEKLQWIE
jgi:hypothetical protein